MGSAAKRTKKQRAAAAVITADAPCTPVLLRAAIVGAPRMPRAALEITDPVGTVIGHVALVNTSADFDPTLRWWLVGDANPGSVVALISDGATQVILPGGRLRTGPVPVQDYSDVCCRMLGWDRPLRAATAPEGWHQVLNDEQATADSDRFALAVRRFRTAAVFLPMVFFLICFPYLFVIPSAVHAGNSTPVLLALPVLGGGLMTIWSYHCRRELIAEAERIEAGASEHGKAIAFTQSYWASMRKPGGTWDGPIPRAIS